MVFEAGVATVRLCRPERRNAIGLAEIRAIETFLEGLESGDAADALLITSDGSGVFCAGFDLDDLASMSVAQLRANPFAELCERIAALRMPTVAALNGDVLGAGVHLAASADHRIARCGLRMAIPATRLGVLYNPTGIARIVDEIGPAHARRMLLYGESLTAEELAACGFFARVVDAGGELAAAAEAVQRGLANSHVAFGANKAYLEALRTPSPSRGTTTALEDECFDSPWFKDAMRRLSARRTT